MPAATRSWRFRGAVIAAAVVIAQVATGCSAGSPPSTGQDSSSAARPTGSSAPASGPAGSPSSGAAPSPSSEATPTIDLDADPAAVLERAGDVPVLCYHQIRDWRPDDSEQERAYIMPPETFRRQLNELDERGYHPISPDQLLAHLTTGAPMPEKPILLSFDDSDANQFDRALPMLRSHDFTATFFIMTVVLGKKHYMSTDQLAELEDAGMTIGAHTWDHHRVDRYSGDDWDTQITEPTAELEKLLGHPIKYFAYPYGAWDREAFPHLREAGFRAAFQLTSDPVSSETPLLTLRRMLANPYWEPDEFLSHVRAG